MTMKTTLDILVAARALIEKPENWCQGRLAANIHGRAVNQRGPDAAQYCAIGALGCVANEYRSAVGALLKVLGKRCPSKIVDYNNSRTHPEVLALFDRAIAAEKRKTDISVFTEILNTAGTPKQPANV